MSQNKAMMCEEISPMNNKLKLHFCHRIDSALGRESVTAKVGSCVKIGGKLNKIAFSMEIRVASSLEI